MLSILLVSPIITFSQDVKWYQRLSFKSAYTFSITQAERSPFSSTRDARRGTSSILFNLQYSIPLTAKLSVTTGIQLCEKGFTRSEAVFVKNAYYKSITYEHSLSYLETPICAAYHYKKLEFIFGLVPGYLLESNYRLFQDETTYNRAGKETYSDISYYATPVIDGMHNRWDLGILAGISGNIYKGINLELTVQKQMFNVSKMFINNEDIRYSLTLAAGIRYKFL